jgi:two-component system, OmpR family, sensor histidine kinase CiaH
MADTSQKRLRRTTFTFWMLLFYIVAALVWWFISLERQNRQMAQKDFQNLFLQEKSLSVLQLADKTTSINNQAKRNTTKYIAEGATFLLLIIAGAIIVSRSIRQQFRLQQQQQNFMMAVTHEFKTPISITKLNLETLQKYNLDPEKQKKIIRTALDENARLNFLTNNILVSSQLESKRYTAATEELDLSDLLKDCILGFKNRFPDRIFKDSIEEEVEIKGDALLLQMMVNNLLENAIKYSPKETTITTSLKKYRSGIELKITDEGPGIPDDEKARVFNKFYRVGNEATRKTQGTGLGLYLCRKIAQAHNGDISVTNNEPSGSTFAVVLKT